MDRGRRDRSPDLDAEPHEGDVQVRLRSACLDAQELVHGRDRGGARAVPRAEGRRQDACRRTPDDSALELRRWTFALRALRAAEGSSREPKPARGSHAGPRYEGEPGPQQGTPSLKDTGHARPDRACSRRLHDRPAVSERDRGHDTPGRFLRHRGSRRVDLSQLPFRRSLYQRPGRRNRGLASQSNPGSVSLSL